jgi:hypothetical protein
MFIDESLHGYLAVQVLNLPIENNYRSSLTLFDYFRALRMRFPGTGRLRNPKQNIIESYRLYADVRMLNLYSTLIFDGHLIVDAFSPLKSIKHFP